MHCPLEASPSSVNSRILDTNSFSVNALATLVARVVISLALALHWRKSH